jgi:class 3 adenylate cyclase
MPICERCGTENPIGFRFCGACGARLAEGDLTQDARKVVTALFCDVADSTALAERLDPEAVHSILHRYFDELVVTIVRHGGTVQKFAGDAVLAIFGIPQIHEDDALRAVRAAAEIRERLPEIGAEVGVVLQFRTGVNTGLVHTDQGQSLAIGDAVNVAARLQAAAKPGEIVLGAETLQMVRDAVEVDRLEPLSLKGKQSPVAAFRLRRVDPVAPGVSRLLEGPLVGRERELQLLRDFWAETAGQPRCRLFTILGGAGVGKSRLVEELLGELGDTATILRGRCLHYGEGITFWPILDALSAVGDEAQEIVDHLSRGSVAAPEELFWEVRALLEQLARHRAVILHIDDLHWAEPMLIDLLNHVVELSREAPILLLCTARPELLEDHIGWTQRRIDSEVLRLEPLGREDCETLLAQLGDELGDQTRAQVIRTSEGNPLFLQEMVALAREQGSADVPPTIHALLAARLDRLTPLEREPLARGAVEGQVFHSEAVYALAPRRPPGEIDERLQGLVRKDLIRQHPPSLGTDNAFRFRHLLIRDTAYGQLPMATRAELHVRFAGWLEEVAAELGELDEIAGWHLEQAVRYNRELRLAEDPKIARRAAEHLYAASRRAADRSDVTAARSLLERALAVAPVGDPLRGSIGVALAERLIESGDLARADELLSQAEHQGDEFGPAALSRLEWLIYSQPGEGLRLIESMQPRMLEAAERAGDQRALAKAHWLAFWVHWAGSRAALAGAQVRLSAEHARAAGDIGLWSRALGWYVATLIYGPSDASTISAELDAISAESPGPYLVACLELGRAEVQRLEGRFEDAHQHARQAHETFRALGMRTMAATCDQASASIELSRGGAEAALPYLKRSDHTLAELGESAMRSSTQAMLGQALEHRGDLEAALTAVQLAEHLSAPQDLANFVITDDVRARLALRADEDEAAERWARSAVARASRTDFLRAQAEAKLQLARVLAVRGAVDEAAREIHAALELFDLKGDQPGAETARELRAALD